MAPSQPDIVLINESTKDIIIGELTCPMEACMTHWHETKTKKYHDLANRIAEKGFTVRFFAFEVGCRGLVGKSSSLHKNFRRKLLKKLSPHCTEMVERASLVVHPSISNHHVNERSWARLQVGLGCLKKVFFFN
jgi:hypothetical protein